MSTKKCYAKDYCKGYGTAKCTERCDFWWKLNTLYSKSNLPMRYRYNIPLRPEQIDREAFLKLKDYLDNVVDRVENGDSLYIYSENTGNGKTTWSSKIMNQYIRKVVAKSDLEHEVLYLNVSLFVEAMRNQYSEYSDDIARLREDAMNCKLLILDDIGAERPSEYVCERLYDLINHRYTNMLSTIYTSNLTPFELGDRLGSRIESRVRSAEQIKLVGADRRTI
ncbi:MAG: DnaA ATPase domain-containing protein [Candidatus Coprovivens sp.]